MEPMIFTFSFTIDSYDVTVTIEFFPHIIILEDSSPELTNDESENVDIFLNLWNSLQLEIYYVLSHFTTVTFYCRASLLQKHFIVGLFSAETLYCWAISYSVFFNHAYVYAIGIAYRPLLSVLI